MISTLFKHRKKMAAIALAVMAFKKIEQPKHEDLDIAHAKKVLEDNGYKISKANKAVASAQYVQQLYKDNPQLINSALQIIRKLGKF